MLDPEGRSVNAVARVRRAILDDGAAETGPRADLLTRVFGETTPRALRRPAGFELVGLRTPDDLGLIVSAPGFAPVYTTVRVPAQPQSPFPIEVKLETRTSLVRFEAGVPAGLDKDQAAFSCHRVETSGIIVAAGSDEVPAQRSPPLCGRGASERRPAAPGLRLGRRQDPGFRRGRRAGPAEGEVLEVGQVRVEMLPVVLAGRVVDQDEGPLANATVEAIGVGRFRDLATTTGADGGFALRAPAGPGALPGERARRREGVREDRGRIGSHARPSVHARAERIDPGPRGPCRGDIDAERVSVRAVYLGDGRRSSRRFNPMGRSSSAGFRAACTR